ncbi:MAG: TetR/AcrR family transcriptional regulator [Myxococcota bacterium]
MRDEQREATREQIVKATLLAMSESGFDGWSTRALAERANVSQGLLTYHFKSREELWRAAADYLFAKHKDTVDEMLSSIKSVDPREQQRELIRQVVYFSAAHPGYMRFIVERGNKYNERSQWLVDTHLRPLFERFAQVMGDIPKAQLPHAFYALAGAAGAIFCVPDECKHVTGMDPRSKVALERHAEYLVDLMVRDDR